MRGGGVEPPGYQKPLAAADRVGQEPALPVTREHPPMTGIPHINVSEKTRCHPCGTTPLSPLSYLAPVSPSFLTALR